ncbi:MAG: Serine/threonine protein kinase PrkC, regulator of stationary phase [Myxococcaceae bacterium]|nr:Serine/threonine protein kinase PrkC, regulator of stationary phase [Myxococcaceae bacterium]
MTPCSTCGRAIPADAPRGLCPPCLIPADVDEELPSHVGEYEILAKLGEGGSGVVYLARQERPPQLQVALKVIRAGELADERQTSQFLREVESQGRLKHPHVVQIYDGRGLDHGAPFFVMQYIAGGTLAEPHNRLYFQVPERAAELLITVARAVQFAHEAGVLHLDLKPANILLDDQRRPYVSDFSIAQRLQAGQPPRAAECAGSLGYMAPELVCQGDAVASTASDVYGLGATLYELLTGRVPYDADDLTELQVRLQGPPALPPRRLSPALDDGLERVCLGAIERDPQRRYRSAAVFADELERALEQRPTAPPSLPAIGRLGRLRLWARRHPVLAVAASVLSALLGLVDWLTLSSARIHEEQLIESTVRGNAALAAVQANDVLAVFDEDRARVRAAAAMPQVRKFATQLERTDAAQLLAPLAVGFNSVLVVGADGRTRARWPAAAQLDYYEQDFSGRDYFRGARALGAEGQVYLSSAFRSSSRSDDRLKFAFASPWFAPDGRFVGALVATRVAASSLRDVQIDELFGNGQLTTLLGPHETARPIGAAPSFDVLIHKQLASRAAYPVQTSLAVELQARLREAQERTAAAPPRLLASAEYRDPVPGFGGRWLAGFAAVPGTPYVVVVQSSRERVLSPTRRFLASLTRSASLLHAAMLLLAVWTIGASLTRKTGRTRRD